MTTREQAVTTEPTAISGLTNNTRYLVAVKGPRRVFVATAGSAPATDDPAFTVGATERITVRPATGVDVYVWAADTGSAIVFDEALSA